MDDETKARLDYVENQLAGNAGFAYVPWSQRRSIPDEVLDLVRAGKNTLTFSGNASRLKLAPSLGLHPSATGRR